MPYRALEAEIWGTPRGIVVNGLPLCHYLSCRQALPVFAVFFLFKVVCCEAGGVDAAVSLELWLIEKKIVLSSSWQ